MTSLPSRPEPLPEHQSVLGRELRSLRERVWREAASAVGMVESAVEALWTLDRDAAQVVRARDRAIDLSEVAIEADTLRLIATQQPVARDLRVLAFILKANADIERVGDHATSIAKTIRKFPAGPAPNWPNSLRELGQRVPMACHALLRALQNEDADAARSVVEGDATIDLLHKQLFNETLDLMQDTPNSQATGLLIYRIGRELERIGDLMTNIAEDIIYLRTGQIVRHEKKRLRDEARAKAD